ncbi:MAG: hypothetical protein AAFP84_21935, partial [Actinomycetota bacterium]
LRALIGALLATVAAWSTSEYVAERWWATTGTTRRTSKEQWRSAVTTAFVLAIAVLVVAELRRSPPLAFGGLMLLTVGAGPLIAAIRGAGRRPIDRPDLWVGVGLIVGSVGVLLLLADLSRLAGGAVVAIGLLTYGRGLGHLCRRDPEARTIELVQLFPGRCGHEPVVASALAVVTLTAGVIADSTAVNALALWVIVLSLMAVGAEPSRHRLGEVAEIAALAVGILLIGLAGWFTWTTGVAGDSRPFLVFLIATVALAGATLVWRIEVIFIGVVAGFMFVWGLASFTVDDRDSVSGPTDERPGAATIVAFGDSYISGEGARSFFDGTDQKGDRRNECRRAPTAYPALLAAAQGRAPGDRPGDGDDVLRVDGLDGSSLDFVACSGAKVRNIVDIDPPRDPDDPAERARNTERRASLPCDPPDDRLGAQYPCGPDDVYGNRLQLDHVAADRSATELVLVSIGGNDARFGEVVTGCLLPGSCADRREIWLDRVGALALDLQVGYERIREAFNPDATNDVPIVVMPYPMVLTESSCAGSPLDSSEHEFISEFTTVLNQQIEAAARRAGVHFFAEGIFAFAGHRICESSSPAVNLVALQPTSGDVLERMDPGSWPHNSMHPNESGHRLIAERLATWLNDEAIVDAERANPDAAPDAQTDVLDL